MPGGIVLIKPVHDYVVSERLKFQLIKPRIIERDQFTCKFCHNTVKSKLDVHHINPLQCGGTNEDDNLITLCRKCHGFFDSFSLPPTQHLRREVTIEQIVVTQKILKDLIK